MSKFYILLSCVHLRRIMISRKFGLLILILIVCPTVLAETTYVTNTTTNEWNISYVNLNGSRWTGDGLLALNLRNDSQVNTTNLVGYWSFDETQSIIYHNVDTEGGLINLTNQGTWYGNTTLNYTTGVIGNAGKFDGVNDYVNAGYDTSLDITRSITISAWIKTNVFGTNQYRGIVGRKSGNIIDGCGLQYGLTSGWAAGSHFIFWAQKSGQTDCAISSFLDSSITTLNKWYYVVATYDSATGNQFLYLNGILNTQSNKGVGTLIQSFASQPLWIGANLRSPYWYFNGSIDEVRIYNRTLTASEISVLYNTSLRTQAMPLIQNQIAQTNNIINRVQIIYTGQDDKNNASIYVRQNGTIDWVLVKANANSGIWYNITYPYHAMDFGIMLKGNGSNTIFFQGLAWDEMPEITLQMLLDKINTLPTNTDVSNAGNIGFIGGILGALLVIGILKRYRH